MADSFNWDVIIRLATQGAKGSADDVRTVADAVDELRREEKLTAEASDAATKSLARMGTQASQTSRDSDKLAAAQKKLAEALSDQEFERSIAGLDRVGQAQARFERSSERVAGLQNEIGTAGKGTAQSYGELTRAVKDQTAAEKAIVSAREAQLSQTNSLRYANYDLARSMLSVSAAITAAGIGAVSTFASQQRAFADVIRTTDEDVSHLEGTFKGLSETIPFTFNALAEIGTLGNQLGVPADQLEAFTETIAKFSTVTGISAEESALAFGKLGNLLNVMPDEYDRLASSIALVGRETAATEKQIISVAGEIAPAAAAAGFTADQVVGLSGALASLKVPPERSRSTILQFFETLNMAVVRGGDKLRDFATVAGMTTDQISDMVRSGQGKDILTSFIGNITASDTLEITRALDALGLAGLRTNPTIRALAGDMDGLNQAIADGKRGWTENTELQRQMEIVLGTLSAKWQMFLNSMQNLVATIGSSVAPAFTQLLDIMTKVISGVREFAETDMGQSLFRVVGAISAAIAAYTALRGVIALATGATLGLSFITQKIGGAGIVSGIQALSGAFASLGAASGGAAVGVGSLGIAIRGLLAATGVGAILVILGAVLTDLRGSVLMAVDAVQWLFDTFGAANSPLGWFVSSVYGVAEVISYLTGSTMDAGQIIEAVFVEVGHLFEDIGRVLQDVLGTIQSWAQGFVGWVQSVGEALGPVVQWILGLFGELANGIRDLFAPLMGIFDAFGKGFMQGQGAFGQVAQGMLDNVRGWANSLPGLEKGVGGITSAVNTAAAAGGNLSKGLGGGLGDVGKGAKGAAKEVRTLVDYANDLQGVFSRAFDLRFSAGSTLDKITSQFIAIREASEESARNIQRLKAEIQGLQSDLKIQQYFLSIALEYKDYKRAEAIQATIADLQSKLADKTADLSAEQSKNSKTLSGNSKEAIANREQMESLVKSYQEHIAALAASGLSQSELARRTAELKQQFIQQATQLGYSRSEVDRYARSFDGMITVINRIPRNITVAFNGNAALQAINEFAAKANKTLSGIGGTIGSNFNDAGLKKAARGADLYAQILVLQARIARSMGTDVMAVIQLSELVRKLNSGSYAQGGFTGQGGKYEPAGIVHRGEYVIPKEHVNQRTGLPYADALGKLQRGAPGGSYANGGYAAPQANMAMLSQLGSLGPMAVQQFQAIFSQAMKVYLDGKTISQNSSRNYAESTAQGAN